MVKISLLGIPHDENSSFMKGPAEAPAVIRRELASDGHGLWSETGIDLGAGRLVDHGDLRSTAPPIPGISSSAMWAARWGQAIR